MRWYCKTCRKKPDREGVVPCIKCCGWKKPIK